VRSSIQRQHRSRKQRTCADCGGTIEVGEIYVKTITLPHEAHYRISVDEFESETVEFFAADTHTYSGNCLT
jgi:hypothetical protein